MHLSIGISFIIALQCMTAMAVSSNAIVYHVHERRNIDSSQTHIRRLEPDIKIPLRIALKQRNIEHLPEILMSVSDPSSPTYGQHWTAEEVARNFTPSNKTVHAVQKWLLESGFAESRLRRRNFGWIEIVNATVSEAEELLQTEYRVYARDSGELDMGCDSYSVPLHIKEHIDIIIPTIHSGTLRQHAGAPNRRNRKRALDLDLALPIGPNCTSIMTPDCLRKLYNINYTPRATANNSFGVVNFHPNTYLQSDLDIFFGNFSPSLVGKSPKFVSIDGGQLQDTSVGEASWILQYAMALSQPQEVTFLKVGDQSVNSPFGVVSFNEWIDAVDGSYCINKGGDDLNYDPQFPNPIPEPGAFNDHSCGIVRPPNVISVSRGDEEQRLGAFYTRRQCEEYGKLGLMGVTVIYGSGNTGTAGTTRGYCLDKNGSVNPNGTLFNPAWPSSCPWITSVGGTQIKANSSIADLDPEEVTNMDLTLGFHTSSGGGFSNRSPIPEYQKKAVEKYLMELKLVDGTKFNHFNIRGRGYPDLSVISNSFIAAENAMITLINDARIAAGKRPVGFINPAIYSPAFSTGFRDVTSGVNTGCKGLQGESDGGFKATAGWDPASGLGTPRFNVLLEKWMSLS
ncbi:hypothetical protein HGRIS_008726 [Hohenbuehelia grisea]|uniref:Peptidase S53 domain-containing protein n=1 Tax=Hohenbuehelia grisea TaxID=104357 RepID=A0ABR3J9X7_9AGAR